MGQDPREKSQCSKEQTLVGKPKPVSSSYGYEDAMRHGYLTEMEKQWLYWREAARREAERAKALEYPQRLKQPSKSSRSPAMLKPAAGPGKEQCLCFGDTNLSQLALQRLGVELNHQETSRACGHSGFNGNLSSGQRRKR